MIWIIILTGLALDFITKRWALATLQSGKVVEIIPGYLDLNYLENRGAAFGLFQGNVVILSVISLLITLGIIGYLLRNPRLPRLVRIALSLVAAGALGNVIDRLFYGFVVDFIHFHIRGTWHFPTFNFADMWVVIGAGLLLIHVFFFDKKHETGEGRKEPLGKTLADTQGNDGRKPAHSDPKGSGTP